MLVAHRRQRHQRPCPEAAGDRRIGHDPQRRRVVDVAVAKGCRGRGQRLLLTGGAAPLGAGPVEQERAELAHEGGIHSCGDLQRCGVLPCREVVAERFEAEAPHALLEQRHLRAPAVEAVLQRVEPVQRFVPRGREQAHLHADAVVPLAERGHPERHDLAGERLGPVVAPRHGRRRQRQRDPLRCRVAFRLPGADVADREGRGASPRAGARGARRRDHESNLSRGRRPRQRRDRAGPPSAAIRHGTGASRCRAGPRHHRGGRRSGPPQGPRRRSTTARRSGSPRRCRAVSPASPARCRAPSAARG